MAADLQTLGLPFLKSTLKSEKTSEDEQNFKEWQNEVLQILHKLQDILSSADLQLTSNELVIIYSILIPLINEEESAHDLANIAADMLKPLPPPNFEIIKLIFLNHIRPLFAKAPHTRIDPSSGRSLPRPAGGPSGSLDFYEGGQEWKKAFGLSFLIIWCIRSLQSNEYEKLWHLIVPPSMTFLDDYESYYKLQGTKIINEFINRAPAELLERTGIGGLIKTSLNNAILHLHTSETPSILENSVQASIQLVKKTSSPGSPQLFDHLCALLGDGILGGVWMYAYQDLETIEMSLVVSRKIVQELGIGTTRYLKAILQQIMQYLSMSVGSYIVEIQIAALKLLEVVLTACRSRIHAWNAMILDGVLRCWTLLQDKKIPNNEELSNLLIRAVHELITIVPSTKTLCENLLVLDEKMFAPLFL